jgi:hypothetical protein
MPYSNILKCFLQMTLEKEAQRLLNLISTVSSDIHRMPKDNLEHMLETLNVIFIFCFAVVVVCLLLLSFLIFADPVEKVRML